MAENGGRKMTLHDRDHGGEEDPHIHWFGEDPSHEDGNCEDEWGENTAAQYADETHDGRSKVLRWNERS